MRVNNLDDKFDLNATTYVFDVSMFAKEYFIEANNDLLAKMDQANLTSTSAAQAGQPPANQGLVATAN